MKIHIQKPVRGLPKAKGGFGCIVADPPWPFSNQATRAATGKHYTDMDAWRIMSMPVEKMAAAEAHLYLWTTQTHLPIALEVVHRWGFEFKTSLVWVKTKCVETYVHRVPAGVDAPEKTSVVHHVPAGVADCKIQIGLGNWYRHAHEICLFGVRGKCRAIAKNLPDVIFAPRGEHSSKPDTLQEMAELMSPGPRAELFARRIRPGWSCWGDEVQPR